MTEKGLFIPVIDLFAGPGGLGEGFFSLLNEQKNRCFKTVLSIEKDKFAHNTLELRAFFRLFGNNVPEEYYKYLKGRITRENLFDKYPEQALAAATQAWHAELGSESLPCEVVDHRIDKALDGSNYWVLIGGPPCQAYSIIGRSRMKRRDPEAFENDPRHLLYREYLRILAVHTPPLFIMENVKGILSAKLDGDNIFSKILSDLQDPVSYLDEINGTGNSRKHVTYRLYSLTEPIWFLSGPSAFVVRMKHYGIPQDRHRVIILGVREDIIIKPELLAKSDEFVSSHQVIGNMPKLRSSLSRGDSSGEAWSEVIKTIPKTSWIQDKKIHPELREEIVLAANRIRDSFPIGGRFVRSYNKPGYMTDWFVDNNLRGVCNHSSRSHMKDDIYRYFFVSCFGRVYNHTPLLKDFPTELLPHHFNVRAAIDERNGLFSDRFRVQLRNRPATTITSHIAKDGHYFIHYDPRQCRSLTVREAARIQTFPDNYFFEGPQTSQYQQVGNAVPPLLANQIAHIVSTILNEAEELTEQNLVEDKLLSANEPK